MPNGTTGVYALEIPRSFHSGISIWEAPLEAPLRMLVAALRIDAQETAELVMVMVQPFGMTFPALMRPGWNCSVGAAPALEATEMPKIRRNTKQEPRLLFRAGERRE